MKRIMNLADRHARALGLLLAAVLAALTAVLNVSRGPLSNLNDIGGWKNRMAFIALAAAAHAAVLAMQALLNRKGFGRLALRQVLTTLGFLLLTLPINQKTLLFTEQVLPLVRKMDAMGLAAANESALNLSAPALTLLYAVTRGPIYDMYSIKLLCVVCNLGLAILAAHAADRRNWGVRAEVLLTLCLILPQGFLAVGCAGQMDIVSVFLLCAALTLLDGEGHPLAAMLVYGAAAAMSGAALYALPLVGLMGKKSGVKLRHAGAAAGVAAALCLPALLGGMTAGNVFASLFKAVFALPEYAAGVPNFESVIPRAAMEEMPQYGLLRQIPALDPQTNASPFYTQTHFEIMTRGMTIAALAMFVGLCAALKRDEKASGLRRRFRLRWRHAGLSGRGHGHVDAAVHALPGGDSPRAGNAPARVHGALRDGGRLLLSRDGRGAAGSGLCVCDLRGGAVHAAGRDSRREKKRGERPCRMKNGFACAWSA